MGARVTGVDAIGCRRQDRGRQHRAHRGAHRALGRRRPGVAARRRCSPRRRGARGRPRRADRGPARPHPPRAPRGVRGRRHGHASTSCPGVAEVAMQGSLHAARTIGRRLRGDERRQSRSGTATSGASRPSAASGRSSAGAASASAGFPAWVVWVFVHLAFLNGFANRLTTLVRWIRWMVGHEPGRARRSASATPAATSARPRRCGNRSMPTPFPQVRPTRQPSDDPS